MSYADLKVTEKDQESIDFAISNITHQFGVLSDGVAKNTMVSINPSNPKEMVAQFSTDNEECIYSKLKEAKEAQKLIGKSMTWYNRVSLMREFCSSVIQNQYKLTASIILECGKDRSEAFAEVREFIELMEYYLELYGQHRGYTFPMDLEKPDHSSSNVVYKPFGTFAAITPFNFPVAMAGMCFCALLTGNAVVWKAAPETLLTGYLLHSCFPKNYNSVFNFTVCDENVFGKVLVSNPDLIDGLTFTGSTEVGNYLANSLNSQRRRGGARKMVMEMGGNNACVVTPSANIGDAGWGIAKSAFGACAQKCSACGRAVIHESMVDQVVESIAVATVKMFFIGDPRDGKNTLGPVINERAHDAYYRHLQEAFSAGSKVIFPVRKSVTLEDGYFVEPAIIMNLPVSHSLFQKELFVPMLRIQTYSGSIENAVEIANNTDYGLTAGIFTQDEQEKKYFFENIEAGVTYANRRSGATTGAWPKNQAFGGWKNSGFCTQHGVCGPLYLTNFMRGQSQYDATQRG